MDVICIISIPQKTSTMTSNSELNKHLSSIIHLRKAQQTISQQLRFIVINNKRIIYDTKSPEDLIETFKDRLENSKVEQDLGLVLAGFKKATEQTENSENILQGVSGLDPKTTKIYINSLYPEKFSNIYLNLKHLIETSDFNLRIFQSFEEEKFGGLSILSQIEKANFRNFLEFLIEEKSTNENENNNFPVSCVCHNEEISVGFVCPVCLFPYCKKVGICKNCKMRMKIN